MQNILITSVVLCFYIYGVFSQLGLSDTHKSRLSDHFLQFGVGCISQYKLNLDDIQALRNLQLPKEDVSYCFFACVLKRAQLMDSNGRISADAALKLTKSIFEDENERREVVQVFLSCDHVNDIQTKDECEKAKLILTCLINNSKESTLSRRSAQEVVAGGLHNSIGRVMRSLLMFGCDFVVGESFPGRLISKIIPGSRAISLLCSFIKDP